MILLLPPSEGKSEPAANGTRLDLSELPFPELAPDRERMIAALMKLSNGSAKRAHEVLRLTPNQSAEIDRNKVLATQPTASAAEVYTGVLFAALDLATLTKSARQRADARCLIMSSLYGVVSPSSPIAAYRLSGSTSLPRLGRVSTFWRQRLNQPMIDHVGSQLLLDLRSGTYESFWPIPGSMTGHAAAVKVWQEQPNGARAAVTHFSKHTKGLLARALVQQARNLTTLSDVVALLAESPDWKVDLESNESGIARLDVTIRR